MIDIPRTPLGLVDYAFRALGKTQVPIQQLTFFLSFELQQMPPSKSKELIHNLISTGDLIVQDNLVSLSPNADIQPLKPRQISTMDLGTVLRDFVSSSRLSRAVGLDDKSLEITRVSKSPLRVEVLAHGTKVYQLILDEGEKLIAHNCPDWQRVRTIRRFCKHVTKLFLMLEKDEALRLLQSIQDGNWQFEFI